MPSPNEKEPGSEIIWAMGGNKSGDVAHAYADEEAYRNNSCLCGRTVVPLIRFEDWDTDQELIANHTCPQCRKRLLFLPHIARIERK